MTSRRRPKTARAAVVLTLALAPGLAAQATLRVPEDFETVQAAIDDPGTVDGDTISIRGYQAANVVVSKSLTLVGRKGGTIDGEGLDPCVLVEADGVTVRKLDLINGSKGVQTAGFRDGLTVERCTISACFGKGIDARGDDHVFRQNRIVGNGSHGLAYATGSPAGSATFDRNRVEDNGASGMDLRGGQLLVERNRVTGNGLSGICIIVDQEGPPAESVICRNRCDDNGDDGLQVENSEGPAIRVEENRAKDNRGWGLEAFSLEATIQRNRCDGNKRGGLRAVASGSSILDNRCRNNHGDGVAVDQMGGDGGPEGDNAIDGNRCAGNLRHGLVVVGSSSQVFGNTCTKNGFNGIYAEDARDTDLAIQDNRATGNGHQGIVNNAQGTEITGNKARQNAKPGGGPDIAGTGDQGVGSVGTFEDNSFGSGGADTPSRICNCEP